MIPSVIVHILVPKIGVCQPQIIAFAKIHEFLAIVCGFVVIGPTPNGIGFVTIISNTAIKVSCYE